MGQSNQPATDGGQSGRRLRDRPARAIAFAALVFALGGGTALAGAHYLITSIKQIKPSVVKKLEKPGPKGPKGPRGRSGQNGTVAAYYATTGSNAVSLTNAQAVTVITKTLPAGSWVITADLSIYAQQKNSSPGVALSCELQWSGGSEARSFVSPWDTADDDVAQGTLTWTEAASLSSASIVTIYCSDNSGPASNIDTDSASISASADISAVQASHVS